MPITNMDSVIEVYIFVVRTVPITNMASVIEVYIFVVYTLCL